MIQIGTNVIKNVSRMQLCHPSLGLFTQNPPKIPGKTFFLALVHGLIPPTRQTKLINLNKNSL